jgi:hypothetical protein
LGFASVYDRNHDQFAYPAAAFVVTPDGRIARALPGLAIDPTTLHLAIIDASKGTVGRWTDHIRLASDADRRMRITFVVVADPVAVVIADARKADHFPSDHVAIAAMDRIGEKPFGYVLQQRVEKGLRIDAVEFDLTRFNSLQRVVLLLRR